MTNKFRARHNRFNIMNEFIADEPDSASGEPWQARNRHRPVFAHPKFNNLKTVAD